MAKGANTGSNIAVVAKLDVISVKKFTAVTSNKRSKISGKLSKEVIKSPNHSARPLTSKAFANAIPPPKSNIIPQGSLKVSSQRINASFLFALGRINNNKPNVIAIIVSSIAGKKGCKIKERLIHEKAASKNTIPTQRSS